eukprot:MONOS_1623.1-p1 / transcript=MONOS_1623.1 / gene=MONOS_1623 / organism=Monocercomonoides_exilis_PA203 / gene_product=DEHA2F21384p / transcript_product=DEHA2F21384p / location=Mono_scaffold00029:157631-161574(-) / protein_length=1001 / sequence_SO=supercontig / SO=protein_coding / is_pseudo=false
MKTRFHFDKPVMVGELEVSLPRPLPWFPNGLAWGCTEITRPMLAKSPELKEFFNWMKVATELGHISRQEAVSMIPPLLLKVEKGMTVIDLCAAPGSKTKQIVEKVIGRDDDNEEKISSEKAQKKQDDSQKCELSTAEQLFGDGGVVVANDADLKRCNILVHQLHRLRTTNFIVVNHDASMFPTIRVSSSSNNSASSLSLSDATPSSSSSSSSSCSSSSCSLTRTQQRLQSLPPPFYFERVLCDVPCSGDGTLRKAPEAWLSWTTTLGLSLHPLQFRIGKRGINLLKMGGWWMPIKSILMRTGNEEDAAEKEKDEFWMKIVKSRKAEKADSLSSNVSVSKVFLNLFSHSEPRMVYSTCTLNPIEDEAVIAELLRTSPNVEIVDVSEEMPQLKRREGINKWIVQDQGKIYNSYSELPYTRQKKIRRSVYPPTADEPSWMSLSRCLRFYPHLQDTGGFFVTVLTKREVVSEELMNALKEEEGRIKEKVEKAVDAAEKEQMNAIAEVLTDVMRELKAEQERREQRKRITEAYLKACQEQLEKDKKDEEVRKQEREARREQWLKEKEEKEKKMKEEGVMDAEGNLIGAKDENGEEEGKETGVEAEAKEGGEEELAENENEEEDDYHKKKGKTWMSAQTGKMKKKWLKKSEMKKLKKIEKENAKKEKEKEKEGECDKAEGESKEDDQKEEEEEEDEEENEGEGKDNTTKGRRKVEEGQLPSQSKGPSRQNEKRDERNKRRFSNEDEQFLPLRPDFAPLPKIREFYGLPESVLPTSWLMCRNQETANVIYLVTPTARSLLLGTTDTNVQFKKEKEEEVPFSSEVEKDEVIIGEESNANTNSQPAQSSSSSSSASSTASVPTPSSSPLPPPLARLKVVNAGVRIFEKERAGALQSSLCDYRICQDGAAILCKLIQKRMLKVSREVFSLLLKKRSLPLDAINGARELEIGTFVIELDLSTALKHDPPCYLCALRGRANVSLMVKNVEIDLMSSLYPELNAPEEEKENEKH